MHHEVKRSTSHSKFMIQLGQEPISSRTGLVTMCHANYAQQLSCKEEALEGTSVLLIHGAPHKAHYFCFCNTVWNCGSTHQPGVCRLTWSLALPPVYALHTLWLRFLRSKMRLTALCPPPVVWGTKWNAWLRDWRIKLATFTPIIPTLCHVTLRFSQIPFCCWLLLSCLLWPLQHTHILPLPRTCHLFSTFYQLFSSATALLLVFK